MGVSPPRRPAPKLLNRLPAVGTPGARPMGDVPVVVRLVLPDGTEQWRPGRANRWTHTQVLVLWLEDASDPYSQQIAWLAVADVAQGFHGRTDTLRSTWAGLPRWHPPRG